MTASADSNRHLLSKKCVPCEGGVPTLTPIEVEQFIMQTPEWIVSQDSIKISRMFKFKNFVEAMNFVNKVADLAESENHHPDITVHYNKVTLTLWTHAIGGLSENDFIVAAKVDRL